MNSFSHIKVLAFIILSLILSASTSYSNRQIDNLKVLAQKYYRGKGVEQDYSKALNLYLEAASLGDSESKYIAGGMYYKGYGTQKDLNQAFSLLYGAAVKGKSTPESQKLLGQFFLTGKSIPRNYTEALKWYSLSAENGDRESQAELAFLYFTGRGIERDFEKAFYWYKKSAEKGLAVSQYSLGIPYYSGNGVDEVDTVKAYAWLSLAAAQGHYDAIIARDYIESFISAKELSQAQLFAKQLFQKIQN